MMNNSFFSFSILVRLDGDVNIVEPRLTVGWKFTHWAHLKEEIKLYALDHHVTVFHWLIRHEAMISLNGKHDLNFN